MVTSEENFILLVLPAGAEDVEVSNLEISLTLILSWVRGNAELHSPKLSGLLKSGREKKTFNVDEEYVVYVTSAGIQMSM